MTPQPFPSSLALQRASLGAAQVDHLRINRALIDPCPNLCLEPVPPGVQLDHGAPGTDRSRNVLALEILLKPPAPLVIRLAEWAPEIQVWQPVDPPDIIAGQDLLSQLLPDLSLAHGELSARHR